MVKARRKNRDKPAEKLYDEEGNEISFEDDSDEMDADHQYIDDNVEGAMDSDEWVDCDSDGGKKMKDEVEVKNKSAEAD